MKNIFAKGVLVAGLIAVFNLGSSELRAQISPEPVLSDLAQKLKTPESIAHYLWRNFSFEKDQRQFGQKEYWQSPQEFLQNGKGDCEDFAIFAKALLEQLGKRAFLFNVYGDGFAHTVCVFEEGGKFHVIDKDRVIRYDAASLEELSKKIYPFWRTGAVVKPSPKGGMILKLVERIEGEKRLSFSA